MFSLTEQLTWDTQLFFSPFFMHHKFIPAGQRIFLLLCWSQCWGLWKKCPLCQAGKNLGKLVLFSATRVGLAEHLLLMILQNLSADSFLSYLEKIFLFSWVLICLIFSLHQEDFRLQHGLQGRGELPELTCREAKLCSAHCIKGWQIGGLTLSSEPCSQTSALFIWIGSYLY